MMISFGGQDFLLHHSGALFWPSENMLIVSDLHLEKASHYARRGYFLPPYDSHSTLSLLADVCAELRCKTLLLLGDVFHDGEGMGRLGKKEQLLFKELLSYEPIWVRGNHDGAFVPEGFYGTDTRLHNGISFRHEALKDAAIEISGHFHPKVDIRNGAVKISRPCFIEDGNKMILPAFGALTGGLDIKAPILQDLLNPAHRIYVLGEKRMYKM